ncbi:MAG: deoxyguanosinetriphosphate triphosphohydrolase [Marmoricola sp.]
MITNWDRAYSADDRERWLEEPPKRVPAPERTAFERDRARVVHSASLRRLAAKTQVLGPQSDDFIRNRLTHSLEVAQVARDLAHPLGAHPDLTETAALAHDLGHPPFGHNGEAALAELAADIGGFEGNAQTLRILTRLEAKSHNGSRSVGLNLTRATLDACTKYPWGLGEGGSDPVKFGVYDDDREVFDWMRRGAAAGRRCVEAQIMDIADDVAYSVHDLEDGIVAGEIDVRRLDADRAEVWATARRWFAQDADDAELDEGLGRLAAMNGWPRGPYGATRSELAALKNLTSDLIGVFCGQVQTATHMASAETNLARYAGDVIVPRETTVQIAVLKAIAAHYVMFTDERQAAAKRQGEVVATLYDRLMADPGLLWPELAADYEAAADDRAARRVIVDQIACLTDASALRMAAD